MKLSDPRTRQRVAVEADVAPNTLARFLRGGEGAVRPASARRIQAAIEALTKAAPELVTR